MNEYLKELKKIEFVVTDACTGRCKHCSQGEHDGKIERIDGEIAADAVRKIAARYKLETVMTFGGEPLLHLDAVCKIHAAARDCGVMRRQVITNGYVTSESAKIKDIAFRLESSGVNDLLLSVDAFHQETIPIDIVSEFAHALKDSGVNVRIQPAWLVSESHDNTYNNETKKLLRRFSEQGFEISKGNVVFPEGNALKYLGDYINLSEVINPYVEDERNVRCVSFSANGDVLGGNVYKTDILDILDEYAPEV